MLTQLSSNNFLYCFDFSSAMQLVIKGMEASLIICLKEYASTRVRFCNFYEHQLLACSHSIVMTRAS